MQTLERINNFTWNRCVIIAIPVNARITLGTECESLNNNPSIIIRAVRLDIPSCSDYLLICNYN